MVDPMLIRVAGRLMRITRLERFPDGDDWFNPVDVRDVETTFESQAIVEDGTGPLIDDAQVRDAIRSVYLSAVTPRGRATGGEALPQGFTVEIVR